MALRSRPGLSLPPPALSERQRSHGEAWHWAASRRVNPQAHSLPFPCQVPMPWGAPFLMAAGCPRSLPTSGTLEPQTQRCGAPTDTPELESSPRGAFWGWWEGSAWLGHPWEHTCVFGNAPPALCPQCWEVPEHPSIPAGLIRVMGRTGGAGGRRGGGAAPRPLLLIAS